jgi:hypothetical protein
MQRILSSANKVLLEQSGPGSAILPYLPLPGLTTRPPAPTPTPQPQTSAGGTP